MFLRLYDNNGINMDDIRRITTYTTRSDKEFVKDIKNGRIQGKVVNWSHGHGVRSVIVTFYGGEYTAYLTSMTSNTILKRIDELQGVKRMHNGLDFTKSDFEGK